MELLRNVGRWGNSAGVLLPREWLGSQVKVIFLNRTLDIKREALSILEPYLEDVLGIYLVGSYARGEQEPDSDVDIIALSKKTKKEISSGKYHISLITLESAKKTILKNPILILPRLNEAKVILNSSLLEELKSVKLTKESFKNFIDETKRIIKIDSGFIALDRKQGREILDSVSIIYSLILRLRSVFLIKCLFNKRNYSKKEFLNWLKKGSNAEESEKTYEVYKAIRDNKKINEKIKIETAEKLLEMLKIKVKELSGLKKTKKRKENQLEKS